MDLKETLESENKDILELDEERLERLKKFNRGFRGLLRDKDLNYESEVRYNISYNHQSKKYQAEISPVNLHFKLEEYFNNVLGGKKFKKSALEIGISSVKLKN